jgi:hypothetical protein
MNIRYLEIKLTAKGLKTIIFFKAISRLKVFNTEHVFFSPWTSKRYVINIAFYRSLYVICLRWSITRRIAAKYIWYTLQRKSHLCIPFLEIARPQSQCPHACVCERFICIFKGSVHIYSCSRIGIPVPMMGFIYKSQTHESGHWDCGRAIPILWKFS